MIEKMIYSKPLLDLGEEETTEAARKSIFMNAAALEHLIEIAMTDEATIKTAAS